MFCSRWCVTGIARGWSRDTNYLRVADGRLFILFFPLSVFPPFVFSSPVNTPNSRQFDIVSSATLAPPAPTLTTTMIPLTRRSATSPKTPSEPTFYVYIRIVRILNRKSPAGKSADSVQIAVKYLHVYVCITYIYTTDPPRRRVFARFFVVFTRATVVVVAKVKVVDSISCCIVVIK